MHIYIFSDDKGLIRCLAYSAYNLENNVPENM
jgi:hypothetical protein